MKYLGMTLPFTRLVASMPEPAVKLFPDALDVLVRRISRRLPAGQTTRRTRGRSVERLCDSLMNRGFGHFRDYGNTLRQVILLTEGLLDGRRKSLSETARVLGVSLHRVKNSQWLFWGSILEERRSSGRGSRRKNAKLLPPGKARAARKWLMASFLQLVAARGGRLLVDECEEDPVTVARMEFLARCSGVAYTRLEDGPGKRDGSLKAASGRTARRDVRKARLALVGPVGTIERLVNAHSAESMVPDDLDPARVSELLGREEAGFVSGDLDRLARWVCMRRAATLTRQQKVVLAMKRLGRPAHYLEIAEAYTTLFPEDAVSTRTIYSCLSHDSPQEGHSDVVWAGGRGMFALSEWGYVRPENPLHVEASGVVARRYAETKRPVPLTVIAAELGERRAVKRSSLLSALLSNPAVRHLGGGLFVPAGDGTAGRPGLKAAGTESEGVSAPYVDIHDKPADRSGNEPAVAGRSGVDLQEGPDVCAEGLPEPGSSPSADSLDRALREFERSRAPRGQE